MIPVMIMVVMMGCHLNASQSDPQLKMQILAAIYEFMKIPHHNDLIIIYCNDRIEYTLLSNVTV